jgi:hypothetical protein
MDKGKNAKYSISLIFIHSFTFHRSYRCGICHQI